MIVLEKNDGQKMDYTVSGTKISFDGGITLDLEKYERDFPVHLDICLDKFSFLTMGLGERYAAQIDIPARQYVAEENEENDADGEEGNGATSVPVPFDIGAVTLTLWAMEV